MPILRVPDPNSRHNRYEDFPSPCKRPCKQVSNKSQCWELRTDPTDSSKCVWRAPETNAAATAASITTTGGTTPVAVGGSNAPRPKTEGQHPLTLGQSAQSTRSVDSSAWDNSEWVIHGCPARMHLCKPSQFSTRSIGCWKGAKAGHFLK